jgi:tRNA (guanine-N1)-methyltransferase
MHGMQRSGNLHVLRMLNSGINCFPCVKCIFTTPDGEQFDQPMANTLSLCENLIILCGHFKGIDYRIREHLITKEVSIADGVCAQTQAGGIETLFYRVAGA